MKTIYKKHIYNYPDISRGFELIEMRSSEKNQIAFYLESCFFDRMTSSHKPRILDLGAGSGVIWNYLLNSGASSAPCPGAYVLDLVDSSEVQTKKAAVYFSGNKNVNVHTRGIHDFLNESSKKYHLISAVHLLANLPADAVNGFVSCCMDHVDEDGCLFIVQPAMNNSLSWCKDQLFREFYNENRIKTVFDPSFFGEKYVVKKEIVSCPLIVTEVDLVFLARFLLGSRYGRKLSEKEENRIFEAIFSPYRADDGKFRFTLRNEFILMEKEYE